MFDLQAIKIGAMVGLAYEILFHVTFAGDKAKFENRAGSSITLQPFMT